MLPTLLKGLALYALFAVLRRLVQAVGPRPSPPRGGRRPRGGGRGDGAIDAEYEVVGED